LVGPNLFSYPQWYVTLEEDGCQQFIHLSWSHLSLKFWCIRRIVRTIHPGIQPLRSSQLRVECQISPGWSRLRARPWRRRRPWRRMRLRRRVTWRMRMAEVGTIEMV
jgi:hypothetical protein